MYDELAVDPGMTRPAAAEDVPWPDNDGALDELGWDVCGPLADKGWCSLRVPRPEQLRERAEKRAASLRCERLKKELAPDFLGRQGIGKTTALDPLKTTDVSTATRQILRGSPADPIKQFDQDLSVLFASLNPVTVDALGFSCTGRTDAMVWQPFAGGRERASLGPEDLDDEDIEDGVVERHLHFLRRRKLCMLYMVRTEGGEISLLSRTGDGAAPEEVASLEAEEGRLLVFRCDRLSFRFKPEGHHVTMMSWLLEDPPRMDLSSIEGDAKLKDELYGLLRGPGAPYHDCGRILGVACETGGSVFDLASAVSMYTVGTDTAIYVPQARFDTDVYFSQKGMDDFANHLNSYHYHGGLCDDLAVLGFDREFFGISEAEAYILNPDQRKVLEVGYQALFNAGHTKASVKGKPIVVGVGDSGTEWNSHLIDMRRSGLNSQNHLSTPTNTQEKLDWKSAGSYQAVGSRLSFQLGLTGPNFLVDTACSSGLSAFNTSIYTLRSSHDATSLASRLSGALAGGCNQIVDPWLYVMCCAQHMVSVKGRCFTFDGSAEGYGKGEGTAMLYSEWGDGSYLERQEGAAIGMRLNQDGRSASMTAPNGPAQQMCIRAALREAGIMPHDLTTSECHGTGTALGDPIEIGSLRGVQERDDRDDPNTCTSSKSNLGHQEANAGTIGLIKTILMGKYGVSPPNVHLRSLNPHLETAGWPVHFQTENVDVGVNSCIAGVSSFGVSGTNAHSMVWGRVIFGPNSALAQTAPAVEKLEQVKVVCPVTMGPIDYLTGEPAPAQGHFGPRGEKVRVRADVLREELAPYDVSSYAYGGGYRFRREALDETYGLLEPSAVPCICGSWSGWQHMEEMEPQDDGSYVFSAALGETRAESFFLCLNRDTSLRLYPAASNGSQHIWVEGPDDGGAGRRWLIDGRDEEIPAGSVYRIRFWWGPIRKQVSWELADASLVVAPAFRHSYCVVASWTAWRPAPMSRCLGEEAAWEGRFRIGPSGQERFQLLRDFDLQQVIYPARADAPAGSCPVRGPDDLGKGKHFLVRGEADEVVHLRLEVDDGNVLVSVASDKQPEALWVSRDGWKRRDYCIAGSWANWTPETMTMDEEQPGVFRYRGTIGTSGFSEDLRGFAEMFRILVDGDEGHGFYPDMHLAGPGDTLVHGPGGGGEDRAWLLRAGQRGIKFEVTLDLHARDRRKLVTVAWETQLVLGR